MLRRFAISANSRAVSGGFDRIAWFYDALAASIFGSALRQAQQAALNGLPAGAPHVLILGGGTGWVLMEILQRRPDATVMYLDASAAMLERAAAQLQRQLPQCKTQVEFRLGTQKDLPSNEVFDALVTFFVLDCLEPSDFEPAMGQLSTATTADARWLVADFRPPHIWWQRLLLATMYRFFRLTTNLRASTLPDWPKALHLQGWQAVGPMAGFYADAVISGVFQKNLEKS